MKKALCLLLFLPLVSFSETKYELARELMNINIEQDESLKTQEKFFSESRETTIEALTHEIEIEGLPQDIIALNEQLIIDLNESDLMIMNWDDLKDAAAKDMAKNFTYDELLELRELYQRPIFKKLISINKSNMKSIEEYTSKWRIYNEELVEGFQKRSLEINSLTREYIDSKLEKQH